MKAETVAVIGDVTITMVREYEHLKGVDNFYADAAAVRQVVAEEPWLGDWCADDGQLRVTFQAFVVEAPGRVLLVDPCIGNDRDLFITEHPLQTSFLDDLTAAVGDLRRIDTVAFTHLHLDHIGWSMHREAGQWTPTFPQARHIIAGTEWEHWRDTCERGPETDFTRAVDESIRPLFVDDLVDLVDSDHELADGIRFRDTAGHSPGHVSIDIASKGERAVITGDILHHPVQIHEPGWTIRAGIDVEPDRASRVRVDLVDELADTGALMVGTHFAGCCAGHVEQGPGGRRWFRAHR